MYAGPWQDVAAASVLLGRRIGMRPGRLADLADAAKLLDVGLVGLPLHVAQRSRPLHEDEEEEYQRHPLRGLDLARDFGMTLEQLNGIIHHHERYDGLGYPMGLAGDEIPPFARVLAIADAYVRLTGGGSGDAQLSSEVALQELR